MDMKVLSPGMKPHAVSYSGTKVATYHATTSFRSYLEDGGKMLLRYVTSYLSNCHTSEHYSSQIFSSSFFNKNNNQKSLKYHTSVYVS
jgi:hypothetical protein